MRQDLRFALRLFARSPSFAAAAVLSLTLGIGANSAMFSVVHAVLLRPLPYREPDRLVAIAEHAPHDPSRLDKVSPANFLDLQQRTRAFAAMAAYVESPASAYNLSGAGEPERVRAVGATGGFFALLGAAPARGRELQAGESRPDRTLVLTHQFWMRKFGGDPRVVGRRVALSEEPHTIIGVLPADFRSAATPMCGASSSQTRATRGRTGGRAGGPSSRGSRAASTHGRRRRTSTRSPASSPVRILWTTAAAASA